VVARARKTAKDKMKKFIFILILLVSPFISPSISYASLYPDNAITIYRGYTGNQTNTEVLPSGTYTILGVSVATDASTFSLLYYCGGLVFYATRNSLVGQTQMNYVCTEKNINITTTGGNKDYFTNITYVPYNLSAPGLSTSTEIIHSFTSGELISNFFLFAIFTLLCIEIFFLLERRIKTRKW
jgi:hypothetical protein